MKDKPILIDKLRKLIAHEQSARKIGSLGEAEVFASTIQGWLTKHKLSSEEVAAEAEVIDQVIEIDREMVSPFRPHRIYWQEDLAKGIAESNSCKIVLHRQYRPMRWHRDDGRRFAGPRYSYSIWFVGEKVDREICVELFAYFTKLTLELAHKGAEVNKSTEFYRRFEQDPSWKAARTKEFKQGFLSAFADAIERRMLETRKNIEEQAPAKSAALVLARKSEEAILSYMAEHYQKGEKKGSTRRIPRSGYEEGRKAGERVALTSKVVQ